MNDRNCAMGYLISDFEAVGVRRPGVERCGVRYGVIDITESIPVSTQAGNLNAKLALWYIYTTNMPSKILALVT